MSQSSWQRRNFIAAAGAYLGVGSAALLGACTLVPSTRKDDDQHAATNDSARINVRLVSETSFLKVERLCWGANATTVARVESQGFDAWVNEQLRPNSDAALPEPVQSQINAMTTLRVPVTARVMDLEALRRRAEAGSTSAQTRVAAQRTYQLTLQQHAREAMSRHLLRALYSPFQLHEQMVWFWLNHFNVYLNKGPLRALMADYEDHAIRPYALGNFRDLVRATLTHPAMLIYLDNTHNTAGRLNTDHARALLELHMLGPNARTTEHDVQELARILSGVGVNLQDWTPPRLSPSHSKAYVRDGLFEFNPLRHDWGNKDLLGTNIIARGMPEVARATDRIIADPACARFICRKLAVFFVADNPPSSLVERMAQSFRASSGDIAVVMSTLINSTEFQSSLPGSGVPRAPGKFKDPMHYVLSAVRLAYDDSGEHRPIFNTLPMINWLNRLAQGLYGRQTPDGYPVVEVAWASPWQMRARMEIAKSLGSGSSGLRIEPQTQTKPSTMSLAQLAQRQAPPEINTGYFRQYVAPRLSTATRKALDEARTTADWNTAWLTAPEFMVR